jgi:hypothetical protein
MKNISLSLSPGCRSTSSSSPETSRAIFAKVDVEIED